MTHPWVVNNNNVKSFKESNSTKHLKERKSMPTHIFVMWTLHVTLNLEIWPLVKVMPLFGHGRHNVVWKIIQIQHGSEELWPGHGFCVKNPGLYTDFGYMFTLWYWPLKYNVNQGHGTPFGRWQQFNEILSRSNMAKRSYSPSRF